MPEHDLVVLGDCNPDLLLTGDVVPSFGQVEQIVDDATLTIGGSGAITAAGSARLGLRTALVSVVGDDSFGRLQLDALRARGVDVGGVRVDPTLPTGVTVVLSRGDDRAILTAPGTIGVLRGELVDLDLLRGARHVHATSYFLQPGLRADLPELLGVARAAGATVSLDTNWDPAGSWDDGLDRLLGMLDVFLPNAAEARLITGEPDVEVAASALAAQVGTVAVKLGASGGLARSGAATVRRAALAAELVDTTGAGDSFAAGFLAGRLLGHPLERALALAVACGSLSTRASGGVDAQPTLEEAESAAAAADRA
jgi:sugar/nucleoside kinase (ribokinase family)